MSELDEYVEAIERLRRENACLRDLLRRWRDCCSQACAGAEGCYVEAEEVCGE